MTRTVFVGPSLHGVGDRPSGLEFLPPAAQGDLVAAVRRGSTWIGLIDGFFGERASVWHKEILFALSSGCAVSGAASMGALRAAECRPFGMVPVGGIAWDYVRGDLNDDAEVALLHGPVEVDYAPFTEPMVDVRATIQAMASARAIGDDEARGLTDTARSIHFTERTLEEMVTRTLPPGPRRLEVTTLYERHRVMRKRADAQLLVDEMFRVGRPETANSNWTITPSTSLEMLLGTRM